MSSRLYFYNLLISAQISQGRGLSRLLANLHMCGTEMAGEIKTTANNLFLSFGPSSLWHGRRVVPVLNTRAREPSMNVSNVCSVPTSDPFRQPNGWKRQFHMDLRFVRISAGSQTGLNEHGLDCKASNGLRQFRQSSRRDRANHVSFTSSGPLSS